MYSYVLTDASLAVVVDGKLVTVQSTAPNFSLLRQALLNKDWQEVKPNLGIREAVESWSKGNFKLVDGTVTYKDTVLPTALNKRMFDMITSGGSPEALMNFWEKLQKNPSWRSVEQLFPFLAHQGIPIQPNGNFLAYKGVKDNYTDAHTGKVDNKPGTVNEMPRNKISDDPNHACHYGYHVGALEYARDFAATVVVCEVDPADVVCIPFDQGHKKMRVCKYRVLGNHNGEYLPQTTYQPDEENSDEDDSEFESEEEDWDEEYGPGPVIKEAIAQTKADDEGLKTATRPPPEPYEFSAAAAMAEDKPKPKEKKLKEQRPDDKRVKLKIPTTFRKLHRMELVDLMNQPLADLRAYATKVLHMVGASKILGGKTMLVTQILKVRSNFE